MNHLVGVAAALAQRPLGEIVGGCCWAQRLLGGVSAEALLLLRGRVQNCVRDLFRSCDYILGARALRGNASALLTLCWD